MRGAERTLTLVSGFFNLNYKTPSWYSGRNWLLRLGYYKLTRKKEKSDDWIWIVDHSVQWGKEKCLVILGVQQSQLPASETIVCHEDVEPLALFPVTQSNGEVVYQQLKDTISKTGVPKQIISDYGTDVKSGIERFCREYSETIFTYDITHKAATILKKELNTDERWNQFTALATSTRKKVQQTPLAAVASPNQRSKARYMNVDTLIKWGMDKLLLLDNPDLLSCLVLITTLFLQIFLRNLQIILPADMRIVSFTMYGIHNDILTGTAENGKAGKDVPTQIASSPAPTGYEISNTNSLTHMRTSGNTKLTFQT